jgi:hypothetical protein
VNGAVGNGLRMWPSETGRANYRVPKLATVITENFTYLGTALINMLSLYFILLFKRRFCFNFVIDFH